MEFAQHPAIPQTTAKAALEEEEIKEDAALA